MKFQRWVATLLLSIFLTGQFGLVGVASAAHHSSSSPKPSVSPQATPVPSDSPAPSPSMSPDPTPDPSASPDPSPSASPDPSASPSPSPSPTTGPRHSPGPTSTPGAPATTGAQGCGGNPPKWVFDLATQTWQAADQDSFTCDVDSGYYLSPLYFYNEQDGWYEIIPPAQVATLPSYYKTAPNVVHTALGDLVVGSPDYQVAQAMGLLGTGGIVVSGTGAGSTNNASISNSGQDWVNLTNLVNVINTLQSAAKSGDVTASANTNVGSSVTGAATVLANLLNLLASAWSWSNGNLSFFEKTLCAVNQTCTGDINLNPVQTTTGGGGSLGGSASVGGTGANSTNTATDGTNSSLNVNAQDGGTITNNVSLDAQSGAASANGNTNAGNVASGNALAEVNIINLINSFINSGSSFFGILNIFGNLNGDILFPNGFLNGALASGAAGTGSASVSGTGPDSTNTAAVSNDGTTNINNSIQNSVANNITTTAASGQASAADNTNAGSVTSGVASTTQGLFNLANSSIFGDNAVLVIVNIAGQWIGKIMDLPGTSAGGTDSALLTGNATVGNNAASVNGTGPGSTNTTQVNNDATANITQSSVGTITNNVNVNAQSGDASADKNTNVGNVASGAASAMSSVANLFNSVLNVKHWFGVLVINVFGSWTGDLGDNTAAGNLPGGSGQGGATAQVAAAAPKVGLLAFLGNGVGSGVNNANGQVAGAATVAGNGGISGGNGTVLTAAAEQPASENVAAIAKGKDESILFILSAVVMLVAGALMSAERRLKKVGVK